jgi:hypothetical protein
MGWMNAKLSIKDEGKNFHHNADKCAFIPVTARTTQWESSSKIR